MQRHKFVDTIARYFNGANEGNADLMHSCFCDDITAYTTGIPPRVGSNAVVKLLIDLHPTRARFTIDRAVVQEPEAVVEWSALWTPPGASEEVLTRGVDWFVFENDKISEIREYADFGLSPQPPAVHELERFPYETRGYPLKSTLDSNLPN